MLEGREEFRYNARSSWLEKAPNGPGRYLADGLRLRAVTAFLRLNET